MRFVIIDGFSLNTIEIPDIIKGNFWITSVDNNGNIYNLINIEADEDKGWKFVNNSEVTYKLSENFLETPYIMPYQIYNLTKKNNRFIVFTYPLVEESYNYYSFSIPSIKIGSDDSNIIRSKKCFFEGLELEILKEGQDVKLIVNEKSSSGVFLNNYKLFENTHLKTGDEIFVSGFKIIYLKIDNQEVLYINNFDKENEIKLKKVSINVENNFDENEDFSKCNVQNKKYFFRAPRFVENITEIDFKIENPPEKKDLDTHSNILMIGQILTTSAMAVMYGFSAYASIQNKSSWTIIFPQLLMCVAMLVSTIIIPIIVKNSEKKSILKEENIRQEKYKNYIDFKRKSISEALLKQKVILNNKHPSLEECKNIIINKTNMLWQKKKEDIDFMCFSLGYGNIQMNLKLQFDDKEFNLVNDNLKDLALSLYKEPRILENVPIEFNIKDNYIFSIIGKYIETLKYVKNIILQLISSHSYDNLKIVLLADSKKANYWEDLKFVPHIFNDDKTFRFFGTNSDEYKEILYKLLSIYEGRESDKDEEIYDTYYLIISDTYENIRSYELIKKICLENSRGFSILLLHDDITTLPEKCKNFVSINGENGQLFNSLLNSGMINFKLEIGDLNIKDYTSKLFDTEIDISSSKASGMLPKKVGFLELFDVGKIEQLNIENRWSESNPINTLDTPVGIGESQEKIGLNLHEKFHGPHGLVAGMTGSGKSEFLISYILSLSVNYHPYEVQFVLIDYKGGGLAGAFENELTGVKIPHLAGVITNLDKSEINRSLISIESELKRRQEEFRKAKELTNESTIDIYKYQKLYREGKIKTPISHLFIISDEFAELKVQQPEFMDKLVSTARIGRSLGVHLILATQKPSGIVSEQIWSNTRFRVCLRVQDISDSTEVLKSPEAAYLKQTGSFYLQVGQNEIFTLGQSAYSGIQYIPNDVNKKDLDNSIDIINNVGISIKNIDFSKKYKNIASNGDEVTNIVKYLYDIGKKLNLNSFQLWLPKLSEKIFIQDLIKKYDYNFLPYNFKIIIGEYDDPKNQKQGLATIDFTNNGNALLYSTSGKGEVQFISTLIYSLVAYHTLKEISIYIIDCSSETLGMFKEFPQVGDVALSAESEKIVNLFKKIIKEISIRKKDFASYNGEYNYYNKVNENKYQSLFIILNGYDNFKEIYQDYDELIRTITRDSAKLGIYFIISCNNSNSIRSVTKENFNNIITLQMNDETLYSEILGRTQLVPAQTLGRGLIKLDDIYEFQTALFTNSLDIIKSVKEISLAIIKRDGDKSSPPIPVLPEVVKLSNLSVENVSLSNFPIGIEKESLEIIYYNFKTKNVNLILTDDYDNITNIFTILKNILINKTNLIIIDAEEILTEQPNQSYSLINRDFEMYIDKIINLNFDKDCLCIIIGLSNLFESLSKEGKEKLNILFSKDDAKNSLIHFLVLGTVDMVQSCKYEKWYADNIDKKNGILFGNIITTQSEITLNNAFNLSKVKIGPNFCCVVNKGTGILVKYIKEI